MPFMSLRLTVETGEAPSCLRIFIDDYIYMVQRRGNHINQQVILLVNN